MIQQMPNGHFDKQTFSLQSGCRTYCIREKTYGGWTVTSFATKQPESQVFWGCKTFRSLAEIEQHYKGLRGISATLAAPVQAVA